MAYTPTEWKKGDTITAALLNHAEEGIAANDTAISSLPEGFQLYGPYYATNELSYTVAAGSSETVECNLLADASAALSTPEGTTAKTFIVSIGSATELPIVGFNPLMYSTEDSQWGYPSIIFMNEGDASASISAQSVFVTFYSDTELPASTPGPA